jgi:uncharacterized membrane protein YbhN (UPF0104 family)
VRACGPGARRCVCAVERGLAVGAGTLANALPLPGGFGGVEAGMIGAFLAFGTHGSLA